MFLKKFSEEASPDVIDIANIKKRLLELLDDLGLTDVYKKPQGQEKK